MRSPASSQTSTALLLIALSAVHAAAGQPGADSAQHPAEILSPEPSPDPDRERRLLASRLLSDPPPAPDLSAYTSAELERALRDPESWWRLMTAPTTSYLDRRAAAARGREMFPVEWVPRLLATERALERESVRHRWGYRHPPLSSVAWFPGAEDPLDRQRTVLGHAWVLPDELRDFPLTWEEESHAEWPWQLQKTLAELRLGINPDRRDLASQRDWLAVALEMPAADDDEAVLFVRAVLAVPGLETATIARLRGILATPELPRAAALVAGQIFRRLSRWPDPRARALAEEVAADVLRSCPHEPARKLVAYDLGRFRRPWSGDGASPPRPPFAAIVAASERALDPATGTPWERLYSYAFSVCEAVDDPPFRVDRTMDPQSTSVVTKLAAFEEWFRRQRAGFEERARDG